LKNVFVAEKGRKTVKSFLARSDEDNPVKEKYVSPSLELFSFYYLRTRVEFISNLTNTHLKQGWPTIFATRIVTKAKLAFNTCTFLSTQMDC
jgi:hypothetical protein